MVEGVITQHCINGVALAEALEVNFCKNIYFLRFSIKRIKIEVNSFPTALKIHSINQ